MFVAMLTLNARQYLPHPSAINIVEDSSGFVPPLISFCRHGHISGLVFQRLINIFAEENSNELNRSVSFECKMDHQKTELDIEMLHYVIEIIVEWMNHMQVTYNDDDANHTALREFISREVVFAQLSPTIIDKITPKSNEFIIGCKTTKNLATWMTF